MIEKAILKIKEEIKKSNDPYVQVIGNYVLKQIEINIDAAEKIVAEDKTVKKSLEEVKKVAKGKAKNGCAVMADDEVFKLVDKYYGFKAKQISTHEIIVREEAPKEEVKKSNVIPFKVDLKSFLKR